MWPSFPVVAGMEGVWGIALSLLLLPLSTMLPLPGGEVLDNAPQARVANAGVCGDISTCV
jgi:hypothetical protein